jgi:hypothetical protein
MAYLAFTINIKRLNKYNVLQFFVSLLSYRINSWWVSEQSEGFVDWSAETDLWQKLGVLFTKSPFLRPSILLSSGLHGIFSKGAKQPKHEPVQSLFIAECRTFLGSAACCIFVRLYGLMFRQKESLLLLTHIHSKRKYRDVNKCNSKY